MAGSGSFLLEATMMAADIATGLMKIACGVPDHNLPPVTRWKSEEDVEEMWEQVLLDAAQHAKDGI
jgi:23S rRNA G2445 N2-methylase RlmL